MSDMPQENSPYDEELVSLIREKGTEGLKEWRQRNPDKEINLQKAPLQGISLEGAYLENAKLAGADLEEARLDVSKLRRSLLGRANLQRANLKGANLSEAHLEEADLWRANLEGAYLWKTHLEGAKLTGAQLKGATLEETHLEEANLKGADLKNAKLKGIKAEGANLAGAQLQGAFVKDAVLNGVNATNVIVDGETLITQCTYDKNTDFTGVGLGSGRIDPIIRADLEYNIRRKHWENWYPDGNYRWMYSWLVKGFWGLSDYGRSTIRLILWFFLIACAFAVVYLLPTPTWFPDWCPTLQVVPIVTNLESAPNADGVTIPVGGFQLVSRALYFSIVTMTTLGFGDIHANPESCCGHWLLMVQVLLGYVMLGVLLARLSILFQSVK